ncbi:MAG: hypothetical protein NTZ11_18405 [Gammaproteobacteria bacterium]|nr:hypothetical protein [Gammaproteobacteria bacterium]
MLAKVETQYGVDAEPDGATDGVLIRSMELTPLELETVDNTVVRPYPGSFRQLITARSVRLTVELGMTGFGTAGPATPIPGYDALLRGCGLARNVSAGVNVTYSLISTGYESLTFYVYMDGVLHIITGARGTVSMSFGLREVPTYRFEFQGLYTPPEDAPLVQPALGAFPTPLPVAVGNTVIANFLGSATGICLNSFEVALGNTLTYRNLVNCREEVLITDRAVTGSFEIEATLLATKDIFSLVNALTLTSIDLTHGTTGGNKVRVASAVAQATSPNFGDADNIIMISGDLRFVPSAANNEIALTVL